MVPTASGAVPDTCQELDGWVGGWINMDGLMEGWFIRGATRK